LENAGSQAAEENGGIFALERDRRLSILIQSGCLHIYWGECYNTRPFFIVASLIASPISWVLLFVRCCAA
jgi:hypothetical protein